MLKKTNIFFSIFKLNMYELLQMSIRIALGGNKTNKLCTLIILNDYIKLLLKISRQRRRSFIFSWKKKTGE